MGKSELAPTGATLGGMPQTCCLQY